MRVHRTKQSNLGRFPQSGRRRWTLARGRISRPVYTVSSRAPVRLSLGRPSRRPAFVLVVVACWTIGFFGLAGGGISVLQLAVAALGTASWLVISAHRRRVDLARERWIRAGRGVPSPTANVRVIGR